MTLTIEYVRRLVDYNPETGEFRWRPREVRSHYDRIWNTQNAGNIAGCNAHHGYRAITLYGKRYYAHRLAYFYMTGEMPRNIDHKNLDTTDNRFANLRPATATQNHANKRKSPQNTSGVKGVSLHRATGKWQASLSVEKRRVWLGLHERLEDAVAAYNRGAVEHFGEYARLAEIPPEMRSSQ